MLAIRVFETLLFFSLLFLIYRFIFFSLLGRGVKELGTYKVKSKQLNEKLKEQDSK